VSAGLTGEASLRPGYGETEVQRPAVPPRETLFQFLVEHIVRVPDPDVPDPGEMNTAAFDRHDRGEPLDQRVDSPVVKVRYINPQFPVYSGRGLGRVGQVLHDGIKGSPVRPPDT